jgi:hypothetical protein
VELHMLQQRVSHLIAQNNKIVSHSRTTGLILQRAQNHRSVAASPLQPCPCIFSMHTLIAAAGCHMPHVAAQNPPLPVCLCCAVHSLLCIIPTVVPCIPNVDPQTQSTLLYPQVAHQAATSSPPATPERAPSDAAAAEGSSDAAAAAAAQAAKLHSVAKKQKDKIAAQKEEIAELRQQVGVLGLG